MATQREISLKTFWSTFGGIVVIIIVGILAFSSRMAVVETRQQNNEKRISDLEANMRDLNDKLSTINSNVATIMALEQTQAETIREIKNKIE